VAVDGAHGGMGKMCRVNDGVGVMDMVTMVWFWVKRL